MSIDYATIATNSAVLAAILIPVIQYTNKKSQTYFLDLMGIPFAIFLVVAVTSVINPTPFSLFLFSLGIALTIFLYAFIALEKYYFEKYRVT